MSVLLDPSRGLSIHGAARHESAPPAALQGQTNQQYVKSLVHHELSDPLEGQVSVGWAAGFARQRSGGSLDIMCIELQVATTLSARRHKQWSRASGRGVSRDIFMR